MYKIKRKAQEQLNNWYLKSNRRPLILRGARQVGKSTLVRHFCENEGIELFEVNLEIIRLQKMNENFFADINEILQEIFIKIKKSFKLEGKKLLFLDEIQSKPEALIFLRYLYEQRPDIPVIAAGSLLEFVLESHQFSMPVGRIEYLHLGPLTFDEYLEAINEGELVKQITESSPREKFDLFQNHFDLLKKHLKNFYFIGGMPEAIRVFIENNDLTKSREVHRSILQTYRNDFPKYAKKNDLEKIENIFDALPHFMGKKIKYSEIAPDLRAAKVKGVLQLFKNARLLHFCYHTNAKAHPLRGLIDEKTYRYFFLDIGLLLYSLGIPEEFVLGDLEVHPLVEGLLAEQFIAQHLAYFEDGLEAPELFYWVKDKKSDVAEVDFTISYKTKIIPVEVKSGASGKLRSIHSFVHSHDQSPKKNLAIRFDLKKREKMVETVAIIRGESKINFDLYNIPIFAVNSLRIIGIE